ncbi:MAG: copper ion binding protein [Bryobacterales bacterium]
MKDKTFATAAIVSGGLASLCCIGPLVAVGLGLGAFGAATLFESLRPYLLVATAALLSGAFYLTYRKQPQEKCEGEACAVGPHQKSRKILLWVVTAAVAALAAFPYYSALFSGGASTASSTALAASSGSATAVFDVEGMTCAGCAATLENALMKTPGVATVVVSLEGKSAHVRYKPSQISMDQLLTVMRGSGFTGTLHNGEAAKLKRISYDVEGMTCSSCALGIQATLSRREGVKEIQVLYDEKTAHVVFDPAIVTAEQLSKAFEELGYRVTPKVGA